VAKVSLTKEQEQSRLRDAANCLKCKQIWARYSNNFCNVHSVSGWQAHLDRPNTQDSASSKKTTAPPTRVKQRAPKKELATHSSSATTGPQMWKIYLGWLVGISALLGGCVALVNAIPDSRFEESTPTTVLPARPKVFPNFISMTSGDAVAAIEKIDPSIAIRYVEPTNGDEYDDAMIVVDQAPPVGAPTAGVMKVCLMIVTQGSQTKDRYYGFSEECPKSQGDVEREAARAWVPNGFELYEDATISGFAFEASLGARLHWKHEDCTVDGVRGQCAYGRLASKNECPAGVALVIEWTGRWWDVYERSRMSTSERIEAGGILEYVTFLPNSSWEGPMKVVPTAKLIKAWCN